MSPRKVRLVATLIKGMSTNDAEAQLQLMPKRAAEPVLKLLRSAVANAVNTAKMDAEKLFVKEVRVDGGPMLKRWLPRAQGRATPIQKKSSHLIIVLEESEKTKKPRFKMEKQEKITKTKAEKIKKTAVKAEEKEAKEAPKKATEKKTKADNVLSPSKGEPKKEKDNVLSGLKETKTAKKEATGTKRKLFQRKSI